MGEWAKLDEKARAKRLGDTFLKVMDRLIDRLLSPVDSKGQPKTSTVLERDQARASLVPGVVRNYDSQEVAVRIYLVNKEDPKVALESVLVKYIQDEVMKLEAKERPPTIK